MFVPNSVSFVLMSFVRIVWLPVELIFPRELPSTGLAAATDRRLFSEINSRIIIGTATKNIEKKFLHHNIVCIEINSL